MRIEALWREMEAESAGGSSAAWLTRYALPRPSQRLLVALETDGSRRALLLPLPKAVIPPRREWPACRGLEVFSMALGGQPHWGVRLREATYADVFAALAEDVAPRVGAAVSPRAAAAALADRLRRWLRFFAAGREGLTVEQQRGLYGELHTLRAHLLPALGAAVAVGGWRAPLAAHQDFQFLRGAVEVKTTTAKQPQAVRITSERQLDDTGVPALFLHVVVVDERELETGDASTGECLPRLVAVLRMNLANEGEARALFDDRLLEAGYLDADALHYEGRRFTVRRELTFHIKRGFPRLTECDLPEGIGDVTYALSLASCGPFGVSSAAMLASLDATDSRRSGKAT